MKQYFALPPAAKDRHCTASCITDAAQFCTVFESPLACHSANPFCIQAENVADNHEGSKYLLFIGITG